MSLRRLHHEQPENFAFTPANTEWAKKQISKYPDGRQASAVIPLLWRGQEQEGWVTRPMIEEVASMLGLADIRVLEVATFYFMFQLQPVGSAAHIQVCGTTSCMICGAEDLISVCKDKIAPNPHQISDDGKLSWEEVECLGACSNAPMAQIGKDYYEDLTAESFGRIIDDLRAGKVPAPGPQNGRWASEPVSGLTSLKGDPAHPANASKDLAAMLGDTVKRIDGTDPVPRWNAVDLVSESPLEPAYTPQPVATVPEDQRSPGSDSSTGPEHPSELDDSAPKPVADVVGDDGVSGASDALMAVTDEDKPELLAQARDGGPDDLKKIKGVGPKLEGILHDMGVFHFDQVAAWTSREVAWVDERLKFKGRIERDGWIEQAKAFATSGETESSDGS
ncbi:MAG: NADH-quinone oxidoreductase subunit E [Pseudomonadota bacterium]